MLHVAYGAHRACRMPRPPIFNRCCSVVWRLPDLVKGVLKKFACTAF
jgi:hypothetical protein